VCYFLPSLFSTLGIISGDVSQLYTMAKNYLLPTALVLLTLSIDFQGIKNLGPKALIMFLTGTLGIIIGGPLTLLFFSYVSPDVVGGAGTEEIWRGLTTVAGSWIGGGANQTAMKEVFEVGDDLFSAMVTVDVIVANLWMACILFAAGRAKRIDAWNGADDSAIDILKDRVSKHQAQIAEMPTLSSTMILLAVGFTVTALAHLGGDFLGPWILENAPRLEQYSLGSSFFWLVVLATTGGLALSLTRARKLEGVGASRLGSVFIYILVATIGMKMDLMAIFRDPELFLIGGVWILFHALLLIVVARLIKAPVFFLAVGSQANVGGAASAPIVAAAFHPSLAPVGVLLAVLGYALGTYGAVICGNLMRKSMWSARATPPITVADPSKMRVVKLSPRSVPIVTAINGTR